MSGILRRQLKIYKIAIPLFLPFLLLLHCSADRDSAKKEQAVEAAVNANLQFSDVTQSAGLGDFRHVNGAAGEKWFPEAMGSGGGFIDYDGDGWEDIILVGGGTWETGAKAHKKALWLYRNNHDSTFTNTTGEAGLGNISAYGFGVTAADYDNDGDQDLFFTTLFRNLFFRNDDGVFTEIGEKIGLGDRSEWSTSALFFDADGDGWLDLYVGSYVSWTPETDIWCSTDGVTTGYCTPLLYTGIPGRYYHNNCAGTYRV